MLRRDEPAEYYLHNETCRSLKFHIIFASQKELTVDQGWCQEFSDRGLTLPTRKLKYGDQGTVKFKNKILK